jgi:hypothetical protein
VKSRKNNGVKFNITMLNLTLKLMLEKKTIFDVTIISKSEKLCYKLFFIRFEFNFQCNVYAGTYA